MSGALMGLAGLQVDYRITDALCDPLSTSQTFVEELVRLPGCFLCYTPAASAPPVSPLPAASNGFITFGSFNNLAKITPEVLSLWARILKAVPTSRLLLKNKPFACESAKVPRPTHPAECGCQREVLEGGRASGA